MIDSQARAKKYPLDAIANSRELKSSLNFYHFDLQFTKKCVVSQCKTWSYSADPYSLFPVA